ncbi:MAG: 50S ribosomal protein L24 [Nitrososphaerota archaeon]|nr:50S ribosomal protein L24 [Candidatus Calditenuaceae archaeon]MDW8072946.1 50S ribosomal protein L24 [Nitrososphaerota archaeon]
MARSSSATKDPSRQRLLLHTTPKHLLPKLMSAHLSQELKSKYERRSLPLRVGDTVKILRGEYRGIQGRVKGVSRSKQFVYIDGLTRKRADGRVVDIPVHVSNLVIIALNLDDKFRKEKLGEG